MNILNVLFIVVISVLSGSIVTVLICRPFMKSAKKLDEQITTKNILAKEQNNALEQQKVELLNAIKEADESLSRSNKNAISLLEQQEKELKTRQELMSITFEQEAEKLSKNYQQYEDECQQNYLRLLAENEQYFASILNEKSQELSLVEAQIKDEKDKINAIIASNKREVEKQEKENFYRLILSKEDIQEINKLREILPYLRDSEPLNKVIWKVYYENPYTDLIGRVVGSEVRTGIYKITNLSNKMCYVGQAVNIADRWRQHIKRGIGAEAPTRNKLYPAMQAIGVENFSFEIIEDCDRALLNEREDYWQDYFGAKEFGYSIK